MFDQEELEYLDEALYILDNASARLIEMGVNDTDPRIQAIDSITNQLERLLVELDKA